MANVKISELDAATAPDGSELVPIVQASETKRTTITSLLLADGTPLHSDVASEIHLVTAKTTPVAADEVIIEDSAASWVKKRAALSSIISSLIDLDPSTMADQTWIGRKATLTAAENLVRGDVCYINSSSKLAKADADAASTTGSLFLALATIAINTSGLFGVGPGFLRDDAAYALTVGGTLYLGNTAGAIVQVASIPTGTDDVVQVVGTAYSADIIFFSPSPVLLERT